MLNADEKTRKDKGWDRPSPSNDRQPELEGGSRTLTRFPWGLSGKESNCQCRRHGFDP